MGGADSPAPRAPGEAAAAFLRQVGHADALIAHPGAGSDLEVRAHGLLALVAGHEQRVDLPELQRLTGITAVEGCRGAFFACGGYTPAAVHWGVRAGLALFVVAVDGEVAASNALAQAWVAQARPH